jgi:hypothetical protein
MLIYHLLATFLALLKAVCAQVVRFNVLHAVYCLVKKRVKASVVANADSCKHWTCEGFKKRKHEKYD